MRANARLTTSASCCGGLSPRSSRQRVRPKIRLPDRAPSIPSLARAPRLRSGRCNPLHPGAYPGCRVVTAQARSPNEHHPGGHAIQQSATTLLPDATELSRTGRTVAVKKSTKIAYLRPALSFEFVQKLALNH